MISAVNSIWRTSTMSSLMQSTLLFNEARLMIFQFCIHQHLLSLFPQAISHRPHYLINFKIFISQILTKSIRQKTFTLKFSQEKWDILYLTFRFEPPWWTLATLWCTSLTTNHIKHLPINPHPFLWRKITHLYLFDNESQFILEFLM